MNSVLVKVLAPVIAEALRQLAMKLIDRYLGDPVFKARVDEAMKLATKPNKTKEEAADAARAIHNALSA